MMTHGSIFDHLKFSGGLGGILKQTRLALHIICLSIMCVLWKERNVHVFKHKEDHFQSLRDKIKL